MKEQMRRRISGARAKAQFVMCNLATGAGKTSVANAYINRLGFEPDFCLEIL